MLSVKRAVGQSIRITVTGPDGKPQMIYIRIGENTRRGAVNIGIHADRNAVKIERTELCTDHVPEYFRTIR